ALGTSICSLLYTIKGVNASKRATQLQVFNNIFNSINALERRYEVEFVQKRVEPSDDWCYEFFNTVEYMAFLLNHKLILADDLVDYYRDSVRSWYKTFKDVAKKSSLDDPDCYKEFKKLHLDIVGPE